MKFDIMAKNTIKASSGPTQKKIVDPEQDKKLKQACQGFEAMFLNTMIKSMRKTLPGNALLEDSNGMDIYKSMYDQHLADELSKSPNSSGIKEFLYQQLKGSR